MSLKITPTAAPLREQVKAAIRRAIERGQFQAGERLTDRDLCEQLGVSRTSVREAIRELEVEGLLESIPNRGVIVARLGVEEARDIYEVRGTLIAQAAETVAKNRERYQIADLKASLADAVSPNQSFDKRYRSIGLFQKKLMQLAGNDVASNFLLRLNRRTSQLWRACLIEDGRIDACAEELRVILEAISNGNTDEARLASIAHSAASFEQVRLIMERRSKTK